MQKYLDSLNQADNPPGKDKVQATFKTFKIVNAQTIETTKKGTLDFRIIHRFGNMGVSGNGGGHTLWGFDESRDIRFSFDYGITDNFSVGVGRSKMNELLDGNLKWRFMTQSTDNKFPLSIALYMDAGATAVRESQLYNNMNMTGLSKKFAHRFSYVSQLIIARKQGIFSFEILPSYFYRNLIIGLANTPGGEFDRNGMFAMGAAFRVKITKRVSITADYFYLASSYRRNNPDYFDPIGVGVEFETGGHVFNINLTNAAGIMENNFFASTTDSWLKGGYKLGFSISRSFTFNTKH